MVTPAAKREAVAHMRTRFAVSERRACSVIEVDRMMVRYRSTRPDDGTLRERLKALAQERRRFGYRRLHVLLRHRRVCGQPQAPVPALPGGAADGAPARRPQACRRDPSADHAAGYGPNVRWSLDFVHDQLGDGRRFRILAIVDDCTRECLALVADTSISGVRVARELNRLIRDPRQAADDRERQRHRADLKCDPALGR